MESDLGLNPTGIVRCPLPLGLGKVCSYMPTPGGLSELYVKNYATVSSFRETGL